MDKQKRINWLKDRISSMEQCRDEIPFGLSDDESMELSAYKDSLASLTAEKHRFGALDDRGDEYSLEFYTAPPVPEIKLPDEVEISSLVSPVCDKWHQADGWNECLAETKRLNGLGE